MYNCRQRPALGLYSFGFSSVSRCLEVPNHRSKEQNVRHLPRRARSFYRGEQASYRGTQVFTAARRSLYRGAQASVPRCSFQGCPNNACRAKNDPTEKNVRCGNRTQTTQHEPPSGTGTRGSASIGCPRTYPLQKLAVRQQYKETQIKNQKKIIHK